MVFNTPSDSDKTLSFDRNLSHEVIPETQQIEEPFCNITIGETYGETDNVELEHFSSNEEPDVEEVNLEGMYYRI